MSAKGGAVGILLALFISCFAYVNELVMKNGGLIVHFMPVGVLGILILILLAVNPLLRMFNAKWPLNAGEVAVAGALGLAACGFAGVGFMRAAPAIVSMPRHMEKTNAAMRGQHLLSYLPHGSPLLAQGQVRDWKALAVAVASAGNGNSGDARRIRDAIEPERLKAFDEAALSVRPTTEQIDAMTAALNRAIVSGVAFSGPASSAGAGNTYWLNREALAEVFPGLVLPPPRGAHVLLPDNADGALVTDMLLAGRQSGGWLPLNRIPWRVWRPTALLWGGMALLMAAALVCIVLIVHPQWCRRELLPYPIARFVAEIAARAPGAGLPDVARSRGFWVACAVIFGIRLLNGLAAWFPGVPEFPMSFGVEPLRELFPTARRVVWSWGLWRVWMCPTVIAFAYFLNTRVAFTLGISNLAWTAFGAWLLSQGIALSYGYSDIQKVDMMRFGSYLGLAAMMLYTGRRYYAQVAAGALGLGSTEETPAYAVRAARGLAACFLLSVLLLRAAGLSPLWGAAVIALILLIFTVMSRVVAETGLFFMQAFVAPVAVLTALVGFGAIGPNAYLLMGLAGAMLMADTRETLMPFLTTGMRMGSEPGGVRAGRMGLWLLGVVVVGFVAAGAVTMYMIHNRGFDPADGYCNRVIPGSAFGQLSQHTSDLNARGLLGESVARSDLRRLALFEPSRGVFTWTALGLGLVLLTAFARLRLSWWPLHPVMFLVWGTYPLMYFGNAFLVGWAIKAAVVKTMGAKGYHGVKPVMVGLIAGDLLGALLWLVVGALYHFATGKNPVSIPWI